MSAFEADWRSLAGQTTLSRRAVVVTSLASGFALAVQPIAAQTTITTDTNGLQAGEVQVKTPNGDIPAYQAMPASGGPFPASADGQCRELESDWRGEFERAGIIRLEHGSWTAPVPRREEGPACYAENCRNQPVSQSGWHGHIALSSNMMAG